MTIAQRLELRLSTSLKIVLADGWRRPAHRGRASIEPLPGSEGIDALFFAVLFGAVHLRLFTELAEDPLQHRDADDDPEYPTVLEHGVILPA